MNPPDELLEFVSSVSGNAFLKVEENFGDGYVRLNVSEAERRQAKHDIRSVEDIVVELLRNSRDAHAHRIFIATSREEDHRALAVVDDGIGIPPLMADCIFEPRVTSKLDSMVVDQWGVHGRGMALFSVRSNAADARVANSDINKGAAVVVVTNTSKLGERADQSTWPTVEHDGENTLKVIRGPHNILRQIVEFAISNRNIDLYVGTSTEMISTMSGIARIELDTSELLSCNNLDKLPVWQRCGAATDAGELVDVAESLGMPISERTAHRIQAGELPIARAVIDTVGYSERQTASSSAADIYRDCRGLKIHHADLARFRTDLEKAFDTIAERYYLHLRREPKVMIGKDDIRVRFEVEKED